MLTKAVLSTNWTLWTAVEVSVGVVSVNAPVLYPLFRKILPKRLRSSISGGYGRSPRGCERDAENANATSNPTGSKSPAKGSRRSTEVLPPDLRRASENMEKRRRREMAQRLGISEDHELDAAEGFGTVRGSFDSA